MAEKSLSLNVPDYSGIHEYTTARERGKACVRRECVFQLLFLLSNICVSLACEVCENGHLSCKLIVACGHFSAGGDWLVPSFRVVSGLPPDCCCSVLTRSIIRRIRWWSGHRVALTTRWRWHGPSYVVVGGAHVMIWAINMLVLPAHMRCLGSAYFGFSTACCGDLLAIVSVRVVLKLYKDMDSVVFSSSWTSACGH